MKTAVVCMLCAATQVAALAGNADNLSDSERNGARDPVPRGAHAAVTRFLRADAHPPRDRLGRPVDPGWTTPPIARAISNAARPDAIATGIAASTEVLLTCQREQSSVLTLPFMRSESQQAHCYRY